MAKKDTSMDWKHQVARAERKSRLARMKGTDGFKKKIEQRSLWKKITLSILAVVIVLALFVWFVSSTGLVTKSITALTVGNRNLTAADLNIFMGQLTVSEQYGLAFSEEFQKILDQEPYEDAGVTIREEFINQLLPSVAFMYTALNEIEASGFEPDDDQRAEMDQNAQLLEEQFTQLAISNGQSVSKLIRLYYGPGASLRMIERDLRNSMLIHYYERSIRDQADLSDEKVEAYYQENRDDLDLYSYNAYAFELDSEEDVSEEEKKNVLDDLVKTAKLAQADLTEFSFEEAILKYVSEEEAERIAENPDQLHFKKERAGGIGFATLKFLKDPAAREGDTEVIEGADSVTLVQFTGRTRDDFKPYSVRHILIKSDAEKDQTDKDLKEKAESVLNEFLDGDRTGDSFVKLVVKHSEDPGSKAEGGLYEDVASGVMVREFEQWCVEDGRKKGDTGIVRSLHGYHIMYFEGYGDQPELPGKIREELKDNHLADWIETISSQADITRHPFGMKFVGRDDFFKALFSRPPAEPKEAVPQVTPAG